MNECTVRAMREGEASACELILRSLPEWFGIEEAIVQYVRDLNWAETYVAEDTARVTGFLALRQHNPHCAEIHVMAILAGQHGRGLGRLLVDHAEGVLRRRSVEYLQVKTLGPSRSNEPYASTREFYAHLGFRPLEETRLWGPANPCLIMVKHLACDSRPFGVQEEPHRG